MNQRNGEASTNVLSIPYMVGDPEVGFKYTGRKISKPEYEKLLEDNFLKYRDGIKEMTTTRYGDNMAINNYKKETPRYRWQKTEFMDTHVNIYTGDMREMTIDALIEYYQTETPFAIIVEMYDLEYQDDLEVDVRQWADECRKINALDDLSPKEKLQSMSKKTMRLKFEDAKSVAVLDNCRMLNVGKNNTFVFLVERIRFISE